MKILITGSGGFIGKNLVSTLRAAGEHEVLEYHSDMSLDRLEKFCRECEFVFHLAGINRPLRSEEFESGNVQFTETLVELLDSGANACPIVFASSIQAASDNAYGRSKLAAENVLHRHEVQTGARVLIYRLPNVFGKWCRPNYNSVVATFCHNIARGLDIRIDDPARRLELVYIDDVIAEFLSTMSGGRSKCDEFYAVAPTYNRSLLEIAELLESFSHCRMALTVPNQNDEFTRKLHATYLSYLPTNDFGYDLLMHADARGSFTEFIRTEGQGQFSINIIKPHVMKGNHWHHTKHEKFLVIAGKGRIRLRQIFSDEIIEYVVSGEKFEVIEIPPGYTHSIENVGEKDMAVIMWANENFNPDRPDTYFMEV